MTCHEEKCRNKNKYSSMQKNIRQKICVSARKLYGSVSENAGEVRSSIACIIRYIRGAREHDYKIEYIVICINP